MLRSTFRTLCLSLTFLITCSAVAQTGPGGVGFLEGMSLWLKADSAVFSDAGTTPAVDTDPVVQWNDLSGNGNDASVGGANPTFQVGGQNGLPNLNFSDDDLDFSLTGFSSGSSARSVFMVAEYPTTPAGQQYFFSYGPNVPSQRYSLGVSPSDNLIVEMQGDGLTSDNTVAAASTFIFSTIYPNGGGALSSSQIFIDGALSTHTGGAATPATTLTSGSVGALADNAGLQFGGDIYEVIYYNSELNPAQRTIVENYLSAKYDVPISNDLYAGDLAPSGDFDFDVFGIGRDGGADHFNSSSGGLTLADDAFLIDDGDYVIAGHSGTPNGFVTTDLPANHNMRLARDWYIDIADATSNGGTINLEFDLAQMGLSVPVDAFSVILITRPGTSGGYTEVMMDTGISGDVVEFYGVDVTTLIDGHKYTVAFATENGLDFDGTDDYVIVNTPSFIPNEEVNDYSFEGWIYPNDNSRLQGIFGVTGDNGGSIEPTSIVSITASGELQWVVRSSENATPFVDIIYPGIGINQWYHIAATKTGSDYRLYVNGHEVGSSLGTSIYDATNNYSDRDKFLIGTNWNINVAQAGTQFDGIMDEVRYWSAGRTQEQINSNAYNTIIGAGNLVASYDFNLGVANGNNSTVNTLIDLTINGNDGNLTGPFALSGNTSNWVSSNAWSADIFPPIFLSGYPLIDNFSTTGFDITVQLNEPGTYYYVVVADGSTLPTVGQVTSASAPGQITSGNINVTTASTDFVLSPSGLSHGTDYDVYIVAEDDEGPPNVQFANFSADVTTSCDNPAIVPVVNDNTYCVGGNGSVSAIASTGAGEPVANYTMTIYEGVGTGGPIADSGSATNSSVTGGVGITASNLIAGDYTIEVINNDNGCSDISTVTVNDNLTNPTISTGSVVITNESSIGANDGALDATGTASGTPGPYTYQWYDDAGLTSPVSTGPSIVSLPAGTYYLEVTDNTTGCVNTTSVIVLTDPPLAPTNVIAYASSATDITIEWVDNAIDETAYRVERADDYAFTTNVVTITSGIAINATSYVFNAGIGQPYYLRVTPINGNEDASSQSSVEFATTEGFAGHALVFDGADDRINIPDSDIFSFGNGSTDSPFSVEAWINMDQINSRGIISKRSGANEWHLVISSDGRVSVILMDQSTGGYIFGESPVVGFNIGEWYHIAFAYDGSSTSAGIDTYINGELQAQNPGVSGTYLAMENTNSPVEIGTINSGASFNFDGQIDEVRVWDFEKTDYSDRFFTLQGNEPNLVAYYSMDEGPGAINVVDGSPNTNDGALTNGPIFTPSTVVQDGVVSNTNDSGPGSLRAAINYANANSPATITFNIPGGGPYTIGVLTTLPDITGAGTIIDGTSQPGWTFGDVNNMVSVDGSAVPPNTSGFNINEAADVEIYGLIVTGFTGLTTHAAIELTGDGSDNVIIGAPTMGNIIHGNGTTGIYITNSDSTIIRGNWIGTLDGATASGNTHYGISATGTVDHLIIGGDFLSSEGNVISGAGNGRHGIITSITGIGLSIKGNHIGTDATGGAALNNEAGGISVGGAVTFEIGGVSPGDRNVISGNDSDANADGITIGNSPTGSITNNYIGINSGGTAGLGNGGNGIALVASSDNVTVSGNVISANGANGVMMGGGTVSDHTITNNIIGLTADGLSPLGNTLNGINLTGTGATNISMTGNTIGANLENGIRVSGDQTNLDISGNHIGVDINGNGNLTLDADGVTVLADNPIGNKDNGIYLDVIDGSSSGNSITNNTIAGNGLVAEDAFANTGNGIDVNVQVRNVTIQGNRIGVEADGVTKLKNINSGVYVNSPSGHIGLIIGGTGVGEENILGYNGDYGVELIGGDLTGNEIHANEFICNEKGGISFNSPVTDAPVITSVSPSSISGTTTAEDNSNIYIYEADSCSADQGRLLVSEAIDAVSGGSWTVSGPFDPEKSFVALVVDDETAINATLSTSEFSIAESVPVSVVTNTNDSGTGSLRDAIAFANANPGTTISFDIPGAGPWPITLATALPQIIANNTVIDGTTQPGWAFGDSTTMVKINGSGIGGNANGININAADAGVYGLIFTGFTGNSNNGNIYLASDASDFAVIGASGAGNIFHGSGGNAIYIIDGDSAVIRGNRIGTLDGINLSAMGDHGISTTGEIDDLIIGGDFFTGDGNLISGAPTFRYGLNLFGNGTGLNNVTIAGNKIGTNEAGSGAMPNTLGGINILGTVNGVEIGGPSPSDLNVISGNGDHGIIIQAGNTFDIDGNYIGLQSNGLDALGNVGSGIRINPAAINVNVGTNSQNLISENTEYGILFDGNNSSNTALGNNIFSCNNSGGIGYGSGPLTPGATIDDINLTSATVTTAAADLSTVRLYVADDGCSNDQAIAFAGAGSVSSGQAVISGAFAPGANYVALVEDGNGFSEFSAPFFTNFVVVTNTSDTGVGSLRAAIDTVNASPGKAIYFNIAGGGPWVINLATELPDITAQGTIIDGTTQTGWDILTANMPTINGGGTLNRGLDYKNNFVELYGIHLTNFDVGVMFNTGGTAANGFIFGAPGKGNILTNNSSNGIQVLTYSGGGTIQSNYFGVYPDSTSASLSNGIGINIGTNGDRVQIGGLGANEGNVVANNSTHQIGISNADSVTVQGNIIGLSENETVAAGLGNGISISALNAALIEENVIAGVNMGIRMSSANTSTIIRNNIGLASDDTTPFGNTYGIRALTTGATNNIIGSNSNTADGNTIAHSASEAILFDNSTSVGNQIQRNSIFGNTAGIILNGAHNGIAPPTIDPVTSATTVTGTGTNGDEVDLYLADGSGHGEFYLGSATVSGGTWSIGSLGLTGGDQVVATATNAGDGTSEFSGIATYTFNYPSAEGSGEALYFDGVDDYVDISSFDVAGWNEITVAAWIKPDYIPGGPGNQYVTIVGKGAYGAAGNTSFALYLFGSDASPFSELRARVDNGTNVEEVTFDANNLFTSEWVHVAMTWSSGNNVNLYVNGVLEDSSSPLSGSINGVGDNIQIGTSPNGSELSFEGDIDEVRIWDFAKTEAEIRGSLAQKITGNPGGLIGYYRMDDSGDALNLTDFNGVNNGTIEGGATYVSSGAHLGDYSIHEYTYGVGSGRDLDNFRVTNLGVANLPLHIYRVSGTPANNAIAGFDNIADTAYYGVFSPGQTYDVTDSIGGLTPDRRIVFRNDNADPTWTSISGVLGTDIEDNQIVAFGQFDNGQFATAIDQNPYPTPVDAGYAMSYDGVNDEILVTENASIDFQTGDSFTVEFWVNSSSTTQDMFVVGKHQFGSVNGYYFNMNGSGGAGYCASGIYFYAASNAGSEACSDGFINDGNWHHIAGVYDNSTNQARLYIDGVLQGDVGQRDGNLDNSENLGIGFHPGIGSHFEGNLDEVRIWDVPLTQKNIRDHMIQKIDADFDSLSHLQAYWRFDENSGTTAADLAGYSDGTVTGATPVISGAPQGQGVISSYDGTPGVLNTAQFGEDINVFYNDATGGIHGYLVDGVPNQVQAEGFDNLDQTKYYGVFNPAGHKVDLRMDYNGAIDADRRIVIREDASDNAAIGGWERLSGLLNTSDVADSVFAYNVISGEVSTAVLNPPSSYPILGDTDPGSALNFDGSTQYVQLPAISINPFVDHFTVELWAKPTALGGTDNLFVQEDGTGTGRAYLYLTGTTLASLLGGGTIQAGSPTVINNDEWYHFAVTYDGVNVTTYINGLQEAQAAVTPESATGAFRIGSSKTGASTLTGDIDEVRIWNEALTPTELTFYANSTDISSHPFYADMLAYYKFDEGTGSTTVEDVFANKDGMLTGMDENTDWVASGALANAPEPNALSFDGTDDYVEIGDITSFDGLGQITVEAWINPTSYPSAGRIQSVVSKSQVNGPGTGTITNYFNGTGGFHCNLGVSGAAFGTVVSASANFPLNEWTHYAFSWSSGNTLKIYVNGVLIRETSTTASGTLDNITFPFRIGLSSSVIDDGFHGLIDEVRIWDVERTESEIQQNLNSSLVGNEAGLLVYYDFNQGVAGGANTGETTLIDLTSNSLDGTLNNFALTGASSNWITSGAQDGIANDPIDLFTTEVSATQIDLSWTDNSFDETDFAILRSDGNNSSFVEIATAGGADATTFSDNTVTADNNYFYQVVARNGNGDSGPSKEKAASTFTPPGNALTFDGVDDAINLGDVLDGTFSGADKVFTIESWIYINTNDGNQIVRKSGTSTCGSDERQFGFSVNSSGILGFDYYGSLALVEQRTVVGTTVLNTGQWYHVAATYDGTIDTSDGLDRVRLYVNGIEESTSLQTSVGSFPFDIPDGPAHLGIGSQLNSSGTLCAPAGVIFEGEMDEIRIWDQVRSIGQIQSNLNNSLIGNEAGLVAYYKFDQTVAVIATLPDRSVNQNDGILSGFGGAAVWSTSGAMSFIPPSIAYYTAPDIMTGAYTGSSFSVAAQDNFPLDLAFNSDGTKMYTVGNAGDAVYEYDLSVAYDLSTAGFGLSRSVGAQETGPSGLTFSADGTKMYVTGDSDAVHEYDLSTPFDIGSTLFSASFTTVGYNNLEGVVLSADGTRMYLTTETEDVVVQYDLSTPYDVSTASFVDEFSVSGEIAQPNALVLSNDGSRMYVLNTFTSAVLEYIMTIPYDVSSMQYSGYEVDVSAEEGSPFGLAFNDTFTEMYIVGSGSDIVYEYNFGSSFTAYHEAPVDDGSVYGSITAKLDGDVFTNAGGSLTSGVDYTVNNLPTGLIPNIDVSLNGTLAVLTLSGNAVSSNDVDDLSDIQITFEDAAFVGSNAAAIINATGPANTGLGLDFIEVAGPTNYALEFDGTAQFVSISDAPEFDIDTDWTIEAWIKTPTTGQQNIVTQVLGNTGYAFFKIGGTLYLQYYSSGGFQNSTTALAVAAGIDDDQWHHVAVSQNGSNGKIYVDGSPVLDLNVLLPIDETAGDVRFGQDPFVGAYTGVLDEVRFWDYQRSDTEILDNFDTELVGNEPGLVAYYPFNDGSPATTVTDQTGNGNDGTLNSMDENTDWVAGPSLNPPNPISNYALEFDGIDDFLNAVDAPELEVPSEISIEVWVKRTRLDGIDIILEKGGDWTQGETNYGIGLHDNANNNMFYFYWNGGGRGTDGVADLNWHHYAVVAQEGNPDPELYIDGMLQTIDHTFGNATIDLDETTPKDLHIGSQLDPGFDYFGTNIIDEIRIWDYARSQAEIQNSQNNMLFGNEAGLVAYYPISDGLGSTIVSEVVAGNDAALNNMDENTDWVEGPSLNPPAPGPSFFEAFESSPLPVTSTTGYFIIEEIWLGQGVLESGSADAIGATGNAMQIEAAAGNFLQTPAIDMGNTISFGYKGDGSGGNTYEVFASSDGGTTFDIPLTDINPSGTYQQYSESLPSNYVGPVRISYSSGSSPLFVDDLSIDAEVIRPDVTVTTLPVGDQTYSQGEQGALIYKFQADIANAVAAFEGLYLVISGADSLDFELDGFKFYQNIGTDDFGSAVLVDSSSWSPGLPVPNGTIGQLWTDFYPDGSTVYFYVTADIRSSANPGTFSIDAPDIDQFGFHDAMKFDGGLTGGDNFTIQTSVPDATFTTIPVTGANLNQGSIDNLVYKFTISASGGDITKQGMIVAVGGDAVPSDFSANGWKLYESSNTDTGIGSATLIGSTNIGDVATDSVGFTMSGDILDGDTHYFYIAVDIDATAVAGHTFNVVLWNGDPTETIGIMDPKNKVDGGFVDGQTFTIQGTDTTSPTPLITTNEVSPTNANPIPVEVDFGEVVTGFDVSDLTVGNGSATNFTDVDGQNFTVDIVPAADGLVTVDIADSVAQDLAGNENLTATQLSIVYDGTGPSITLDQDGLTVNDTNLSGTISDSTDVIQISVDGGATLSPASNEGDSTWTYPLNTDPNFVGDGVYTIYLEATDTLGNQTIFSTGSVTIDQTGPTVSFDQDGQTVNVTDLTGTISDANDVIQISLDAGTTLSAVTNNGDGTWAYDLSTDPNYIGNGAYSIYLDAADSLGNQTIVSTGTVTIDLVGPVITFDQDGITTNATTISGAISDPSDVIQLSLDAGTTLSAVTNNGDGTWAYDLSTDPNFVGDGLYSIYLDAVDTLANQTIASGGTITIDQTAPIIEVDLYGTSITSPQVTGIVDDLTASIEVTVNGETNAATNAGDGTWILAAGILTDLADGTYEVIATATDLAGNVGTDLTTEELVISQDIAALKATQITSTSFRANWSEGLDVSSYQLDVSTESDFSTFLPGYEDLAVASSSRSTVVSGLDFSTTYYYRVRLINTASQVSGNSNTRVVKTSVDLPTLADSLALVQIHDAISPQGLNWGTDRLRDWNGVTLDATRTRVNIVNISGTQASGDMPNPFSGDALDNGGLSNMTGMDVSGNEITSLMDFSTTSVSTLVVSDNSLQFDDIEPLIALGISSLDYADQSSVQYNQRTDGSPIEIRYTNNYVLSIGTDGLGIGGSANNYTWYRNDVIISSGDDFSIAGPEAVIQSIDYDNMGNFRTEISSSLVPDLVIEVDPQIVWAVADMVVSVVDENGDPLEDPIDGYMLEAIRRSRGFDTLEVVLNAAPSTFTFPDVVLGNYIIAINSNPEKFIPTYFGDVFQWTEAETLFFRSDDVIDMIMTEVPPPTDGPGNLDVLIEEDFGEDNGRIDARRRAAKRKCGLRRKRSGGRTGQDDDDFELIAYGETDDNGEFKFGFLPSGVYRFFVEYPGIPLDESSFVQFEVGEEGISDTDFKLQAFATEDGIQVEIEAVLGIILEYFKDLEIFPNPSSEYLNIRYRHLKSGDVTAQLVDLAGNTKWSTDLRNGFDGDLKIDVTDYQEGIYMLRFFDRESPNDNVVTFRVIVKK